MSGSLPLIGAVPPRKKVAKASLQGETDRKTFAMGAVIDRAVVLSGLTKQQVAGLMGYEDASSLSRWISGVETPNIGRLFAVEVMQWPLIEAFAEASRTVLIDKSVRRQA